MRIVQHLIVREDADYITNHKTQITVRPFTHRSTVAQQRLEPVQVLFVAGDDDGGDVPGGLFAVELLPPCDDGTAPLRRDGDGEGEVGGTIMPDDEHTGRFDRLEDAFVRIVFPVRSVHHEGPASARSELEPVERVREALGPPPLGEERRVLKGIEDLLR